METPIEKEKQFTDNQATPVNPDVFTISRYLANYIVIAITFFSVGAIVGAYGHARTVDNDNALIQKAVNAAYAQQEAKLSELIGSLNAGGGDSAGPNAVSFIDDDPFFGPEDAPITIVEFSDFNCGYCKRFHDTTFQPLMEQYEGQIRFIYRDFAILGETSITSAIAAECANDQGRFWDYHDLLFANQGNFSRDNLIGYANQLELDTAQFTECIDNQTHLADVRADSIAAQQIGASGTPAFLINGQFVSGAQPLDVFIQVIDSELANIDQESQ